MEDLHFYASQILLGLLGLANLFVGYANLRGMVKRFISKKSWISALIAELLIITAVVVWDIVSHPHDGWGGAVLVYLFAYFMALIAWYVYRDNTLLSKDKVYLFYRQRRVAYIDREFIEGVVYVNDVPLKVFLPVEDAPVERFETISVKLGSVERGGIIVVPTPEQEE